MDEPGADRKMPNPNRCPRCGNEVNPALGGLCPACLLQEGANETASGAGERCRFTPPSVAELAGKFPQFEILELIGKGGMGAVYKARQKQLDRLVALKILPPGIGDAAFAQRFAREAKALAKLNHPGIVTIYDFGCAEGLYYFAMEFVDGVTLRQLLQNGRVSPREALAIVPQICDALQFAHDHGIVHRDIKPENILMDRRGRVKVADFGLAKLMDTEMRDEAAATGAAPAEASGIMGTPNYMAPEQVEKPSEVDHRADIYALGVVFYQMLTGELPGQRIEPPSSKVQIDVRLDEIVLRALEKNPARRYEQASVFKTQVESVVQSQAPSISVATAEPPSEMKLLGAFWTLIFFGGAVIGLLAAQSLRSGPKGEMLAYLIAFLVAPVAALMLRSKITRWRETKRSGQAVGRPIFLFAGILSVLFSVVVGGFAIFFGMAFLGERGGWNPSINEAIFVTSTFVGAVLLPLATYMFFKAAWRRHGTGKPSAEIIDKATAARWSQMACFAGALIVLVLGIRKLTQFDLKIHEMFFGVVMVATLAMVMVVIGYLVRPDSAADKPAKPLGHRGKKVLQSIALAAVIAVVLRLFVVELFYVTSDAMSPELPRGSRVVVFKLTKDFSPGDIIAFRGGPSGTMLGRFTGTKIARNDGFEVSRGNEGFREVSGSEVIGRVVMNTRSARPGTEKQTSSKGVRIVNDPPFAASFEGGVVQLIALSGQPVTNSQTWLPNGEIAPNIFPNDSTGYNTTSGRITKQLALYVRTERGSASAPIVKIVSKDGVSTMGSSSSGDSSGPDGKLCVQDLACPKNAKQTTLQVGVAHGPWETSIAMPIGAEAMRGGYEKGNADGKWELNFQALKSADGSVAISYNYSQSETWETRVVVALPDGTVLPMKSRVLDPSGGLWHAMTSYKKDEFSALQHICLQRRKYQWVEFGDVSLVPGYRTSVKVRDAQALSASRRIAPAAVSTSKRSSSPSEKPLFSPIRKKVMTECLDLDTGELINFPENTVGLGGIAPTMRKAELAGVDLYCETPDPDNVWPLGSRFILLPRDAWRTNTAEDLLELMNLSSRTNLPLALELRTQKTGEGEFPNTYAFKTREGTIGLLQVLGKTVSTNSSPEASQLGAMVVLYKTVSSGLQTSVHAAKQAGMSSKAVRELVLHSFTAPQTIRMKAPKLLFDFDAGQFKFPPPNVQTEGTLNAAAYSNLWQWASSNGVEAVGDFSEGVRGMRWFGVSVVKVPDTQWDNGTPDAIWHAVAKRVADTAFTNIKFPSPGNDRLQAVVSVNSLSTDPHPSRTFAFRTSEGRLGYLQLQEVSDDPRGFVRFQYKLVQIYSAEQREDIVSEAGTIYSRHVRRDPQTRGDIIPPELWTPNIAALEPIRVVDDHVNVKIVLTEDEHIERGLYVQQMISSFIRPREEFLEFTPLNQEGELIGGGLYRYTLPKKKASQ